MGTRGAIGFILDGQEKITYNHFDSYPDGLGEAVVEFVRHTKFDSPTEDKVRRLRLVKETDKADPVFVTVAKKLGTLDISVAGQSEDDWYCVLRDAQGRLDVYLKLGIMIDNHRFMLDSLFCEYAYIVNLDTNELEFYRGYNRDRSAPGRYAGKAPKSEVMPDWNSPKDDKGRPTKSRRIRVDYAGVRLVGTCPLDNIPDDWKERFYKTDEDEQIERE